MSKKANVAGAGLAFGAIGAAIVAGLGNSASPREWLASPVTQSVPAGQVSPEDRAALASAGAADDVRLVAERAGKRFYVGTGPGRRCYISGSQGTAAAFGTIACLDSAPENFPSAKQSILDFSEYRGEPAPSSRMFVGRIAGFAADGVSRVAVITASGKAAAADVVNNVYASDTGLSEPVVKIEAYDAAGAVIWSQPIGGPPPPTVP